MRDRNICLRNELELGREMLVTVLVHRDAEDVCVAVGTGTVRHVDREMAGMESLERLELLFPALLFVLR
jgi:uncharacterized protein YabE (DUF348 family)